MLPKIIVVGTDGSSTATEAVRTAIDLSQAVGATLHIVTAYKEVSALAAAEPVLMASFLVDGDWREATSREAKEVVDRACQWAAEAGVTAHSHALGGPAAEAIMDVASSVQADLIVVGDKGMTGLRRFIGA